MDWGGCAVGWCKVCLDFDGAVDSNVMYSRGLGTLMSEQDCDIKWGAVMRRRHCTKKCYLDIFWKKILLIGNSWILSPYPCTGRRHTFLYNPGANRPQRNFARSDVMGGGAVFAGLLLKMQDAWLQHVKVTVLDQTCCKWVLKKKSIYAIFVLGQRVLMWKHQSISQIFCFV